MSDEQPLTVRQLIEMLRSCDPDAPVMIECEDDFYSCPLTEDRIEPTGYSVHRYGSHQGKDYDLDKVGNLVEKKPRLYPAGTVVYADGETPRQDLPWLDSRPCVVIRC